MCQQHVSNNSGNILRQNWFVCWPSSIATSDCDHVSFARYSVNVRGLVWSIQLPFLVLCLFSSVLCCCTVAPCGSITDYYQSRTLTGKIWACCGLMHHNELKKSHNTKARIAVVFTLLCCTCLECHCYWHFYWSVSCWHQQVSCHIYPALVSLKQMLPLCPLHCSLL